jgi:hypothetical protein
MPHDEMCGLNPEDTSLWNKQRKFISGGAYLVTGHTPNTLRLGRGFILAMQPIKSLKISPDEEVFFISRLPRFHLFSLIFASFLCSSAWTSGSGASCK